MELILKTIGNRKEIVREVVRGDKHNLRKSANRNAQISVIHSAHSTDLCFAICRFSQVVFVPSNNFTHNLLFYFPIVFSINLIPFFDISSVLAVPSPGLPVGYVLLYFTWATARSQELLFVVLACHALRALDSRCRLRTRRRVCICIGSTRCRGMHMHDHSRFQRDIDDVTGVSLSLSTTHKSHSRTI